ncbi:2-acylglycerol O-acyltransferase 2-A-like [Paramacrobiotus metropolitanus]|uniref:2-acylglycerol O-acyltransferase 2-A-like n=1 Tax=Paramacrobiotus metropolitanus TaxID=2943436 RepID=UPI0024464979|nr:2-acylglycerol O-acyltransferase 2-A-like [Paramacrobiotus metropolitanus]XP_055327800.1 2-acylglycerol O-acyltransferase 2-A-like [Paramacrobiotus metropolitanus]
MHVLGVELAPLHVPLERRLQTLAVLFHVSTFLFMGLSSTFLLFMLLFTPLGWLSLLYAVWYVYDWDRSSRGGRRSQWVRQLTLWRWLRDYFPVRLVKTAELDPRYKYILGAHPHGIMGIGFLCSFVTESLDFSKVFPGIQLHLLSLKLLHQLPLYREYVMSLGVCDVSKESIDYLMKQGPGTAIAIVVGGAKEVFDAQPGNTNLVLKNRKGFVKMAIQHGAHLVPTFAFGENDIYRLVFNSQPGSWARRIQRLFQVKSGYAPVLFTGRGVFNYTFGILPHRRPITVVVGSPIPTVQNDHPSQEEIDITHRRYLDELRMLFDTHKHLYGHVEDKLEFIE